MVERSQNAPKRDPTASNDSKEANISFFDSDDDGNIDSEHHWTFPHMYWAEWLWKEMQQQGFYSPHVKATYKSDR
jgi:hypothetical protein